MYLCACVFLYICICVLMYLCIDVLQYLYIVIFAYRCICVPMYLCAHIFLYWCKLCVIIKMLILKLTHFTDRHLKIYLVNNSDNTCSFQVAWFLAGRPRSIHCSSCGHICSPWSWENQWRIGRTVYLLRFTGNKTLKYSRLV